MPSHHPNRATSNSAKSSASRSLIAAELAIPPKTYSWITETRDPVELNQRIRLGFEFECLIEFKDSSRLPSAAIARVLGLPSENIRRCRRDGRLTPAESDRLVRLSSLFDRVVAVFQGDKLAAKRWLTNSCAAFRQQTPLQFSETEFGANEVERLLGRMEHGVFS
ncbi:MAG: antitoxin Xre/MbcA/ParS toxin-binding domain-containing protein [Planctomycetaceae bacterium]